MKTILNHIAKKNITKWVARDTARAYWTNLTSNGWAKDGINLTKDHHCFTFEPHGSRVALSYRKLEVAS
jgi:hypothetical protein